MEFEWDEDTRAANRKKHHVDILEAALIFENWTFQDADIRCDYGEVRYKSIGMVEDDCYVVIFTWRSNVIRLISAWKGGRRDRRKYQAGYARRDQGDEGQG